MAGKALHSDSGICYAKVVILTLLSTGLQEESIMYYVYVMTNFNDTVVYIGVRNNLIRRVHEHKTKINEGFTERYKVNKLIHYEMFDLAENAIEREKQLKGWTRSKKERLIKRNNPNWEDLSDIINA